MSSGNQLNNNTVLEVLSVEDTTLFRIPNENMSESIENMCLPYEVVTPDYNLKTFGWY